MPLDRSRHLDKPSVDTHTFWWIWSPIGSTEHHLVVGITRDVPTVLVNKPVVKTTQQDQIVEVGGSTLSPMLDVMDLYPSAVLASRELTHGVSIMDHTTQPAGNDAAVATNANHLWAVMNDRFDHGVTTQTLCGLIGNQCTVL